MKQIFSAAFLLVLCNMDALQASVVFTPDTEFLKAHQGMISIPHIDMTHLRQTPATKFYTAWMETDFADEFMQIGGLVLNKPLKIQDGISVWLFVNAPWEDNLKAMTEFLKSFGVKLCFHAFKDMPGFLRFSELLTEEICSAEKMLVSVGWEEYKSFPIVNSENFRISRFRLYLNEPTLVDLMQLTLQSKL